VRKSRHKRYDGKEKDKERRDRVSEREGHRGEKRKERER
jgi:hypothetical protein